ncbi:MAG: hypothetical protein AAFZ09_02970 [Pseudomonadota bacterium]
MVLTLTFGSAFGLMPAGVSHASGHGVVVEHAHHGHAAEAHHHDAAVPGLAVAGTPSDLVGGAAPGHENACHEACCPHVVIGFRLGAPALAGLTSDRRFGDDRAVAFLAQSGPDKPPRDG